MPKVGLSTGVERREILRKAAKAIRSETAKQITARPVIMPRVSPPGSEMTRTRGDAIRGVLEELIHFHNDEIKYFEFEEIIVCAEPGQIEGMDQFSSAERMKELPIRVENLYEQGPWEEVSIQDAEGNPSTVRVNRRIKESAFRISISVPSSDPVFGVYGSLQNMIFAVHPADRARLQGVPEEVALSDDQAVTSSSSLLIPDAVQEKGVHPDSYNSTHRTLQNRVADHRESNSDVGLQYRTLYKNLAHLAEHLMPDLAFVDGTFVVDGSGSRLEGGFALSGDDAVAVDTVLASLLGMDIDGLGHLQYLQQRHFGCADEGDIKVAVGNPDDLNISFSPHPDEERRLSWRHVRIPGEDGEAVGYIAPEQDVEQEEEEDQASAEEAETASAGQTDEKQTTSDDEGEASKQEESTEGAEKAAAVEPDEDLDVKERVRRRLIRRGKMEGELPDGATAAETGTKETEQDTTAESEPEGGEEEGQKDTEETEPTDEEQKEQEQETGEAEQEADTDEASAGSEDTGDRDEGGETGTVSGADVVLAGDNVRDRVRNRLIQRGKMEGELPEGVEMPEPSADSDEIEDAPETAESDQESEEAADAGVDQKEEQASESAAEEERSTEETPSEEASGTEDEEGETTGNVSGEEIVMAGDDVRERVRNRLIQRGKMEGELPEGVEAPSASDTSAPEKEDEDVSEGQGEADSAEEKQEADEEEKPQSDDVAQEDETGEAAEAPAAQEDDLSPRERIERRLIRRGKMEGELPEGVEEEPGAEEGTEQETESAQSSSAEPAADADDADHVDETVEVTTSSGPSLEPSEDVPDSGEVLQNLSGYQPEEKIRHRLAIRRKAVQGSAGDNGSASGTAASEDAEDAEEVEAPENAVESDGQTEEGQETSGDEEEAQESEDVSGYERDPEAPLRDRVEKRLSERGKI